MVHPSPRITTVNRSAERRAKLEDARWPAARRRILRLFSRIASLSAALSVMLYSFPPLLDAARAHPVIPASFLTAEERLARKRAGKEAAADVRIVRELAAEVQAATEQTAEDSTVTELAAEVQTATEQAAEDSIATELAAEVQAAADQAAEKLDKQSEPPEDRDILPSAGPETDSIPEDEARTIPELILLPLPDSAREPDAVPEAAPPASVEEEPQASAEVETDSPFLRPHVTASTFQLTDVIEDSAVKSQFAVLLDARTGEIIAERSSDTLINPASMTKVLTLLTAVECLTGPDGSWDLDSYTWSTKEISEYCWANDCSMAWFTVGEWVPVRDTLYGMILPSGADAALMLASYAAGSQEALVEKMNAKAREMDLTAGAHFENCVGLYGENHICTVRDMAVIMKAAMDHPVCRTVLGKEVWTTSQTEEHPGGILLVNRFLRRIKNEDTALKVIGAKTGYVRQAGNCAVSMARRADGREFICVTAKGPGSGQVIRDHAALYRLFCA